jgi:hypothetical protein
MTLFDYVDNNPLMATIFLLVIAYIGKIWIDAWRDGGHDYSEDDEDEDEPVRRKRND